MRCAIRRCDYHIMVKMANFIGQRSSFQNKYEYPQQWRDMIDWDDIFRIQTQIPIRDVQSLIPMTSPPSYENEHDILEICKKLSRSNRIHILIQLMRASSRKTPLRERLVQTMLSDLSKSNVPLSLLRLVAEEQDRYMMERLMRGLDQGWCRLQTGVSLLWYAGLSSDFSLPARIFRNRLNTFLKNKKTFSYKKLL